MNINSHRFARVLLVCVLALAGCRHSKAQTVPITGTITNVSSSGVGSNAYLQAELAGCGNNRAIWSGGVISAPFQYQTDANGNFTGTIITNPSISCGNNVGTSTNYWMQPFIDGNPVGPRLCFVVTATFDWNTAVACTVAPTPTPPATDSIYARLDGGNTPFTANINALAFNRVYSADYSGVIQTAFTAASTTGAVAISPNYGLTDSFTNPNNVPVFDMRSSKTGAFTTFGASAYRGFYDVRDFGIDCTGSASADSRFTTLLSGVAAGGGTVRIPYNCEPLTTAGWSTGTKGVRFRGEGNVSYLAGTAIPLLTLAADYSGCEHLNITDSNASGNASTIGVAVAKTSGSVSNWYFNGCNVLSNETTKLGTGIKLGNSSTGGFALKGIIHNTTVQGWNIGLDIYGDGGAGRSNANAIVGSNIRGNATNIRTNASSTDNLMLLGDTVEGATTGIDASDGIVSIHGTHLENSTGAAGQVNVKLAGASTLASFGNSYSQADTNKNIFVSAGAANHVSVGDRFWSNGITHNGTGVLSIYSPKNLGTVAGTGKTIVFDGPTITAYNLSTTLRSITGFQANFFGASGVAGVADSALPVQISAAAAGESYFGANKAATYGSLFGFSNGAGGITAAIVKVIGTDPFRLYINNTTLAMETTSDGKTAFGGGNKFSKYLSATASLDYAAWGGADCQDLTLTVTGAADGDSVYIGVPTALSSTAGVQFTGFVSSANTVTVRGCKTTAGASANPAAATVRADVWQH